MIDKEYDSVNHIVGTTTNDYMTETYKKNVRELSMTLLTEFESIEELDLQESKKYLIDYLITCTFKFEKNKDHTFIHDIKNDIEKKIFVTNKSIDSKIIEQKESPVKNSEQDILLTTQQMKEQLLKLN